ncbi:hypothetical protein NP493_60g01057 [Ridgeia piscesae]|uniref:Uncharacterized protein n=1 Tax=Ridgeia piscesae TaxID=27915 RepID=A0AAD9PAH7_RIDPI|nr:hypothetical protein NP493_60g01057 [Ridgeia piscesae]
MTAIHSEVSRHRNVEDDAEADTIRQQSLLRFPRSVSDTHEVDDLSEDDEPPDKRCDSLSPDGAQLTESMTSEKLLREQQARSRDLATDEELLHERTWESPSPVKTEVPDSSRDEDKFYDQMTQSLSTLQEEQVLDDDEQEASAKLSTKDNEESVSVGKDQDDTSVQEDIPEENVKIHDAEETPDDSIQPNVEANAATTNVLQENEYTDSVERRSNHEEADTAMQQNSIAEQEPSRSSFSGKRSVTGSYKEGRQVSPPGDDDNPPVETERGEINSPDENTKREDEESRSKKSNASSLETKERTVTPDANIASAISLSPPLETQKQPDMASSSSRISMLRQTPEQQQLDDQVRSSNTDQNDLETIQKVSQHTVSGSLNRDDVTISPTKSLVSGMLSQKDHHNGKQTPPQNTSQMSFRDGSRIDQDAGQEKHVDEKLNDSSGTVTSGNRNDDDDKDKQIDDTLIDSTSAATSDVSGKNVEENHSKTDTNKSSHSVSDDRSLASKDLGEKDSVDNEGLEQQPKQADNSSISSDKDKHGTNATRDGNDKVIEASDSTENIEQQRKNSNQTPEGSVAPAFPKVVNTGS